MPQAPNQGPAERVSLDQLRDALLTGQTPRTLGDLEPIVEGIARLAEGGELRYAAEVFVRRLDNGRVFIWLPAPAEGLECVQAFVGGARRRRQVQKALSSRHLAFFLNEAGLLAQMAGDLRDAVPYYKDATEIDRRSGDRRNLSIDHQNYAELLANLGDLSEAETSARQAHVLARSLADPKRERDTLATLGYTQAMRGRVEQALASFQQANALARDLSEGKDLYSIRGVWWADLLIRIGRLDQARELTAANMRISERYRWSQNVARCHWILGRLSAADGDHRKVADHFTAAFQTMREGRMLQDLPWVLVARGGYAHQRRAWDDSLTTAEEALDVSGKRGLAPAQAEARILRGRTMLDRATMAGGNNGLSDAAAAARDDAGEALSIARRTGYAWAQRDALRLLADALEALGRHDAAVSRRHDAEGVARRLDIRPHAE